MMQKQIDLLVSNLMRIFRLSNILKISRKLSIKCFYKLRNVIKKLYVTFKLHFINLWGFLKNKFRKKWNKYEQRNNEFWKLVKQNSHKNIEGFKVDTIAIWEDLKNIVQNRLKKKIKVAYKHLFG